MEPPRKSPCMQTVTSQGEEKAGQNFIDTGKEDAMGSSNQVRPFLGKRACQNPPAPNNQMLGEKMKLAVFRLPKLGEKGRGRLL